MANLQWNKKSWKKPVSVRATRAKILIVPRPRGESICRRSRSLSASRNIKRRRNVRRLVLLKETENAIRKGWRSENLLISLQFRGLRGGGREQRQKWDYYKLANAIKSHMQVCKILSKKEMWNAIAQEYFGDIRVERKTIDQIRMLWRRNSGNVRELVQELSTNRSKESTIRHKPAETEIGEKRDANFEDSVTESRNSKCERKNDMDQGDLNNYVQCESSDPAIENDNRAKPMLNSDFMVNFNAGCNKLERESSRSPLSHGCHVAEFLGSVVGRTVTTVYEEHLKNEKYRHQNTHTVKDSTVPERTLPAFRNNSHDIFPDEHASSFSCGDKFTCSTSSPTPVIHSNSFPTKTRSPKKVHDIASDDCSCYECPNGDDSGAPFLETQYVSSTTANTLCRSNIPSSGVYVAKLKRLVSLVLLPAEWIDLPIKCIPGKTE